jgi:serine/threonine protein kinase
MKLCPTCQNCSGDETLYCPSDKTLLEHHRLGTQLIAGRYFLLKLIGSGGAGAVHEALDRNLRRECALKLLRLDRDDLDPNGKERLRQEALVACRIDHRNVVRVYDWGTNLISTDDRTGGNVIEEIYVAMELLRGQTLQQFLARKGRMTSGDALSIVRQAAQGLAQLHAEDVIHRDLKPANLMLTIDRRGRLLVKIIDLGAIKQTRPNNVAGYANLTRGLFIGSPKYASPEMCNHQALDERSDIYSLGLVLYEMLAGRPAFEQDEFAILVYNQVFHDPPRLKGIPHELARLVYDAIEKDPARRIQSAEDFVQRCRELERSQQFPSNGSAAVISALRESGCVPPAYGVDSGGHEDEETRVSQRPAHNPITRPDDAKLPIDGTVTRIPPPVQGDGGGVHSSAPVESTTPDVPPVTETSAPSTPAPSVTDRARIAVAIFMLAALIASSAVLVTRRLGRSTQNQTDSSADQISEPVSSTFTGQVGEEAVTTTDCNLRESFSVRSQRVGLVEKGSRVRILDQRGNRRRIVILQRGREQEDPESDNEGWIDSSNLKGLDGEQI